MNATPVPEDLLRRIRRGQRFLLTSHLSPDGDAIGSEVGLARLLRRLGKSATIWNRDPVPSVYSQLSGADRIHVGEHLDADLLESCDTAVLLECPSVERCGLESRLAGMDLINIDHHMGNQLYGVVNWVDTGAPAAGEMVFRLAGQLKVDIDPEAATALYLALASDTGGFRFSNANRSAFDTAGELVALGAVPEQVAKWLYESRPAATMRLVGEMLRTLELHHDDKVATVVLTPEMFERSGAEPNDTEGLIDYPRSIAGTRAVAVLRQLTGDQLKVSLRSRGEVDVERVARAHGGGGHRNAAGFSLAGNLDETRALVVGALAEALE